MKIRLCFIVILFTYAAFAQTEIDRGKLGLGFQATMPVVGMSIKYDLNNHVGLQGAFGVFGEIVAAGARVNVMRKRPYHNAMLYLSYGTFQYDYTPHMYGSTQTSNNGIGVGFGLEWFFRKLPEVGVTFDVGFIHEITTYDKGADSRDTNMVPGIGVHYYFK